MAEVTTFGKLKSGDLFVSYENPNSGYFSGVMEKGGQEFSQFFNIVPGMFSGVIIIAKDSKVIKVYEKPFRGVAAGHMFVLMPGEGLRVLINTSTLYKKTSEGAAMLLDNFNKPLATELFHGHEKVIDFSDAYKVKVVVKIELDLEREYGNEI